MTENNPGSAFREAIDYPCNREEDEALKRRAAILKEGAAILKEECKRLEEKAGADQGPTGPAEGIK